MNTDEKSTASCLPQELCSRLGFVLAKAEQELHGRLDRVTAADGLSIRHLGVLTLVAQRGPMRQTDIADAVRLDRTTVMNLVDDLEAAGFVRRGRDQADRRANAVTATDKGRAWLQRLRPKAETVEQAFLAPLTPAEQAILRELLIRLVTAAPAPALGPGK